jgi:L-glyceraldehyde 3-phosphate reductase
MSRYDSMEYRRAGASGITLPAISLGLWHNFGDSADHEVARAVIRRAFDLGITHLDLANNYGPPPGAAETAFGKILASDLQRHRDELIISTKAGYLMWPGPYGDGGSRKYLLASLDQSLKRLGLDYVDVFYHHRPDPDTPLEETMLALDQAVRSGKALYAGLSNYGPDQTREASRILRSLGTPLILHQPKYSMFDRSPELGLLDVLDDEGMGCVVFSPLAQGLLTNKYLSGIPADSRAADPDGFLNASAVTDDVVGRVRRLNDIAQSRNQTLAQMALSWVLRFPVITSAIVGVRTIEQLEGNIGALESPPLTADELREIDDALALFATG